MRLAGWSERDSDSLPRLVCDLRAAEGRTFAFPDEAARLHNILQALADGQTLPSHRCILFDRSDLWPTLWQEILRRLTVSDAPASLPAAQEGTSLRSAQTIVRGGAAHAFRPDASFRYLSTRSETAACEFIAASLRQAPQRLSETVIYCEDDAAALRLDSCLNRLGLATMGATAQSIAHPVLQVLPLCLSLIWEPVDPETLLDFLTLPVNPLPRRAASRLAESLSEQPGLGSDRWEETLFDVCSETNDPDGTLKAKIGDWLLSERATRGGPIASNLVRQRCNRVAMGCLPH